MLTLCEYFELVTMWLILQWAGHVLRTFYDRNTKRALEGSLGK